MKSKKKKRSKQKLKLTQDQVMNKFFEQCKDRMLYGDCKYGKKHYTSYQTDELYYKLVKKLNQISMQLDERKVLSGVTRHPACMQIEAADLANYAMLFWMEAKILELRERKLIKKLPQFRNGLTDEQIRKFEKNME